MASSNQNGDERENWNADAGNLEENTDYNQHDQIEQRNKQNAFFLLRTKERNLLTQKCLDDIVEGSTELVQNTVDAIKSSIEECLQSASIQFEAVPGLEDLFSPDNPIYNPFQHVLTKHKQVSYFKESFGLIVSCFFFVSILVIIHYLMRFNNNIQDYALTNMLRPQAINLLVIGFINDRSSIKPEDMHASRVSPIFVPNGH